MGPVPMGRIPYSFDDLQFLFYMNAHNGDIAKIFELSKNANRKV